MRKAVIDRNTKETQISIELNIDGRGDSSVETPIGFLTHMIESFARHGLFDISMSVKGDTEVDQHHTVEDTGIVLGKAFKKALGNKRGINRSGHFIYPMDESLAVSAVDIGGRPYLQFDAVFKRRMCGKFDTDLVQDFFEAFSANLDANIFVKVLHGRNDHHKIEALFKAFAKAMRMACSKDPRSSDSIPSTKGVL